MAHRVHIKTADADRRLDKFLFAYLREAPHPLLYKLLRKKRIKLNGARAEGNEVLADGDTLDFYLSPETLETLRGERTIEPAEKLTGIIFEDDELLIVNKPVGLPSHGGLKKDHLLARVLYYLYDSGCYRPSDTFTPALCNRLDTNTSGVVVCGKTLHALQKCTQLFANGGFEKEYYAIVEGKLEGEATLIGDYFKDETTNTAKITPHATTAKQAVTRYQSVAANDRYSLLRVYPITGRSHQIRAHMASIGHPLAGDKKYGGKPTSYAPAQLLHAHRLTRKDTGDTWVAELPAYFHIKI